MDPSCLHHQSASPLEFTSSDKEPTIKISIYGRPYLALLDQGSANSFINQEVANFLRSQGAPVIKASGTVKGAEFESRIEAYVDTKIHWPLGKTRIRFNVVPKFSPRVILGRDFMRASDVLPITQKGYWTLANDQHVSVPFEDFATETYISIQSKPLKDKASMNINHLKATPLLDSDLPKSFIERRKEQNKNRTQELQHACSTTKKVLASNHQIYANRYNKGRSPHHFQVGDSVLRRRKTLSNAAKGIAASLLPIYEGPFRIDAQVGTNTVSLMDMKGIRNADQNETMQITIDNQQSSTYEEAYDPGPSTATLSYTPTVHRVSGPQETLTKNQKRNKQRRKNKREWRQKLQKKIKTNHTD